MWLRTYNKAYPHNIQTIALFIDLFINGALINHRSASWKDLRINLSAFTRPEGKHIHKRHSLIPGVYGLVVLSNGIENGFLGGCKVEILKRLTSFLTPVSVYFLN